MPSVKHLPHRALTLLIISVPCAHAEDAFINSIGLRMIQVPAGTFMMGTPLSDEEFAKVFGHPPGPAASIEARPAHEVHLWSYYLGETEVTVQQFDTFVVDTRYLTSAERRGAKESWKAPGFQQSPIRPVVCVSYEDATVFCEWLSRKEGRTYRLPTEAEWEYACRAGTNTVYYWGDKLEDGVKHANLKGTADGDEYTSPAVVHAANPWGFYDMIGNVWEWCYDWYSPTYYSESPSINPRGPDSAKKRCYRGFSWMDAEPKPWFRNAQPSTAAYGNGGFRVMAEVPNEAAKEAERLARLHAADEKEQAGRAAADAAVRLRKPLELIIVQDKTNDGGWKTEVLLHIAISGDLSEAGLRTLLLDLLETTKTRAGYRYHKHPSRIHIYAYTSVERAKAGWGRWVAMLNWYENKNNGMPVIEINQFRLELAIHPPKPIVRFGLSDSDRQNVFKEVVVSEIRSMTESDKREPPLSWQDPQYSPESNQKQVEKNINLQKQLLQQYKRDIIEKYKLTEAQLDEIDDEAWEKDWPWPVIPEANLE